MASPSSRAFSSGNSPSVSATALSTVGTRSLRSTPEKSHSSTQVTAGTSLCARAMCSAISRRTPRSGSRRPSPGSAPPAAPRTSCSVIRPCGPVPVSDSRSTSSSCAKRRTSGVARTFCGASFRGSGAFATGAVPSSPMTTRIVPTGTTAPSSTRICATLPAAGEGISTVVLSVWISTSGWSSATSSPSDTSQRATSPSVRPSPRSGSLNSYAIAPESIAAGPPRRPPGRSGRAGRPLCARARPPARHRPAETCPPAARTRPGASALRSRSRRRPDRARSPAPARASDVCPDRTMDRPAPRDERRLPQPPPRGFARPPRTRPHLSLRPGACTRSGRARAAGGAARSELCRVAANRALVAGHPGRVGPEQRLDELAPGAALVIPLPAREREEDAQRGVVREPRHRLAQHPLGLLQLADVPQRAAEAEHGAWQIVGVDASLERGAVLDDRLGLPAGGVVLPGAPKRFRARAHAANLLGPNRVVAQHGVDALDAVHELGHAHVDDHARERQRIPALEPELAAHQPEHPVDGLRSRLVEILVEAEGEPRAVDPRDRVLELEVRERDRQAGALHGRLDRELRHLPVTLACVPVPGREQGSVDWNRQVERRPLDELGAVDVPAPAPRRGRLVHARLRRRHPDHAQERPQVDLTPELVAPGSRLGVEPPHEPARLAVSDTETLVERGRPAARVRDAPGADPRPLGVHGERVPGLGSAHLDRPEQRMARVELLVARLEELARPLVVRRRADSPAGVGHEERDRVSRVDRERGREVGRKVSVQVRAVERKL